MSICNELEGKGALDLKSFLRWSSIGRTKALEEIYSGRLPAVKLGKKLLIPVSAAEAWLDAQPSAATRSAESHR